MYKKIFLLFCAVSLSACSGLLIKQKPNDIRGYKTPDYFAHGQVSVAFRLEGDASSHLLSGVLRVKKIGEQKFDVLVMGEGAYKVMQAVVTPEAVTYQFVMKQADVGAVRSRVENFLNVLLYPPTDYLGVKEKHGEVIVSYGTPNGRVRYFYQKGTVYPFKLTQDKFLSGSALLFDEYTPYDEKGDELPHLLVYNEGSLSISMALISLRSGAKKPDEI